MDAHNIDTVVSAFLELLMAVVYGMVLGKVEKPSHETLHCFLVALYLAGFATKMIMLLVSANPNLA